MELVLNMEQVYALVQYTIRTKLKVQNHQAINRTEVSIFKKKNSVYFRVASKNFWHKGNDPLSV